jgi:predicted RNA methylase
MFNSDFYPTPKHLISEMVSGIQLYRKSILDPSAGKGDILDFCRDREKRSSLHAIEIEPELQAIITHKGHTLLHDDFLTYDPEQTFDLILMNPPFSEGARHLLKAIEIANGTQILCLLNSETILNAHTRERQLLLNRLEQTGAKISHLGARFKDAERKTPVNVTLVNIPAGPRREMFSINFEDTEQHYQISDLSNRELAKADVIESLVERYEAVKNLTANATALLKRAEFYAADLIGPNKHFNLFKATFNGSDSGYEAALTEIRRQAWGAVFDQTKLSGVVTTAVRERLNDAMNGQSNLSFTVENIDKLLLNLIGNIGNIRQECIENAFDLLTKFYSGNKVHVEGWKTNDAWQIREKVIVPYCSMWDDFKWGISVKNDRLRAFQDIERALCFVTGKEYDSIKPNTIEQIIEKGKKEMQFNEWYDSEFFQFKVFKKGTIHLKFNSKSVCRAFNIEAAKGRNWLPANYGRATV